jgi:hypothetical protein
VYNENGNTRPFNMVIETPGSPNTIAVRNKGQLEFPFIAYVTGDNGEFADRLHARNANMMSRMTVQGGALRTFPFEPYVESVKVRLYTDGRPLNARIELLQGPNNNKQVIEMYSENGFERPFFAVVETPGSGNVIRVVNTATVEFPLTASVEPHMVGYKTDNLAPIVGGDPNLGTTGAGVSQWS